MFLGNHIVVQANTHHLVKLKTVKRDLASIQGENQHKPIAVNVAMASLLLTTFCANVQNATVTMCWQRVY